MPLAETNMCPTFISRVMVGDLDDAIGFISVCIFYQEKGTFGAYGSMNYT